MQWRHGDENARAGKVAVSATAKVRLKDATARRVDMLNQSSQLDLRQFPLFRLPVARGSADKVSKPLQAPLDAALQGLLWRLPSKSGHQLLGIAQGQSRMNGAIGDEALQCCAVQSCQAVEGPQCRGQM